MVENGVRLSKGHWMFRLAVIYPDRFDLRMIYKFRQPQIIVGVFRRYSYAFREIQHELGRSGHQVFNRNDLNRSRRKICTNVAAHGRTVCPEKIDAHRGIGVNKLQNSFTWRVQRVDVPEQEIAAQCPRDAVEPLGDKVDVI
jgi:hypothetical protein